MRVPSFFANKAPKFVLDNLSTYEIAPQLSFLVLLMMMADVAAADVVATAAAVSGCRCRPRMRFWRDPYSIVLL